METQARNFEREHNTLGLNLSIAFSNKCRAYVEGYLHFIMRTTTINIYRYKSTKLIGEQSDNLLPCHEPMLTVCPSNIVCLVVTIG